MGFNLTKACYQCFNCGGDDDFKTTSITFTEIGKGSLGPPFLNNGNSVNRVIDNLDEWRNLISTIDYDPLIRYMINFNEIDIDFSKSQIIVVFDNEEMPPSTTDIKTVTEYENEIIVTYAAIGSTALVAHHGQSFHIVKIPRSKKIIKFQEV